LDDKDRKWYHLDSRSLSNLLVVCAGILLYLGLTHLDQVRTTVRGFLSVVSPFIGGFAIAYLLNAPTDYFEEKFSARCRHARPLAVITVYLLSIAVIAVLLQLILPQVADSISSLVNNISGYMEDLKQMVLGLVQRLGVEGEEVSDLMDLYDKFIQKTTDLVGLASAAVSAIPDILNFGVAVKDGLVAGLTAFIASIYMLLGKDRLIRQMKKLIYALFPARVVRRILDVAGQANKIFAGFINGKLIDSAIIGVLCFILCAIFRIPYAVLVSVVVGVTNVIPFFGPIIGAVPCLMILVIVDPWAALRFGVLIIALQQFDGNILGPKILGDSTGLSAMWVLVAIIVGGGLFGFAGMLLGVPTFAVLYALLRQWADRRLAEKGIDANGERTGEEAGARL